MKNEYNPESLSPPGDTIKELLTEHNLTATEFSLRMAIPHDRTIKLLSGEAVITEKLADKLAGLFGLPAPFWLAREKNYRENIEKL